VQALRDAGAYVFDLRLPLDLLVGYAGKTLIVEIKDGKKPKSAQAHTDLQARFFREWIGGPVVTVNDVAGALRALRVME
jgi:hypothetical protein